MAWNGSGCLKKTTSVRDANKGRSLSKFYFILLTIFAVGLVVLLVISLLPKTDDVVMIKNVQQKKASPKRKIFKVHKQIAQKPELLTNKQIRMLNESETNLLSAAELEYWKMFHPYPPPDKDQPIPKRGNYAIFDQHVDNEIAAVLATEPGTMIIGNRTYGESFERRFRNSIKKPIIVNEDDSDYDKSLKRSVIQAKIEMKDALDNGEDIGKMMADARDELAKLGRYRAELEKIAVREITKAQSDAEVEIVIDSVNRLLESKGIAPIAGNALTRIGIKMQEINKNHE
jgi:hypothetical protein